MVLIVSECMYYIPITNEMGGIGHGEERTMGLGG